MRSLIVALIGLFAVTYAGDANADLSGVPEYETPFAIAPTSLQTGHLIPKAVLETHKMQTVDMRCQVGPKGSLERCFVDRESELGLGMCEAALAAAPLVQMKERFSNGKPLRGLYVSLQMIFDVGGYGPFEIIPARPYLSETPIEPAQYVFPRDGPAVSQDCNKKASIVR